MLSFLLGVQRLLLCIMLFYVIVLLYQSGTVFEEACYGSSKQAGNHHR